VVHIPQQAAAHLGESTCVPGVVTNVFQTQQSTGQPTLVNLGQVFVVVIWEQHQPKFSPAPEQCHGTTLTV